ncbi:MAG: glycoside hydrolase family 3 C-terminal domain-containing protein [Clostridia bacterium]|nr:glycoside hydrolase family 3 C-terminal domain-containing protein [Clostridia bacterium]
MKKYARFLYHPCLPLGEDGKRVTASKKHIELSRKAAGEGMVLLKNNGTLPLAKGTKVVLFGQASYNYMQGGGGSGVVNSPYVHNLYDGFNAKAKEGKVEVFSPLEVFYKEYVDREKEKGLLWSRQEAKDIGLFEMEDAIERDLKTGEINRKMQVQEIEIPQELFEQAVAFADTAIIAINRHASEVWDRVSEKGDYYLSDEECNLIEKVTASFKHCIVVLNVGGIVDTTWFKENDSIDSVLMAWVAGMEGGYAIADILCGDVNPSGKLTDTLAKSCEDYPFSKEFTESGAYVEYSEDIYVGYRYFETIPGKKEKVNYPFGYGLSYTNFKVWAISCKEEQDTITVTVNVTNTGDIAGKEVVQIYYSAPQGVLGKPAKELVAFQKTKLLLPNETQTVTMHFAVKDMASYDDLGKIQKSAYLLEAGDYELCVGTSVRDVTKADFVYQVKENRITEQLTSKCAPCTLKKRMLSDGTFESLTVKSVEANYGKNTPLTAKAPQDLVPFEKVGSDCTLDEFIAQMTDDELCEFMGGSAPTGVCNTSAFSGMKRVGVPDIPTADGPAGLRLNEECGISTTAFPCATLLACTWDPELVEEVGNAGAKEVKENNLAVWLTPGLNIHRHPLCGRNFEYFSEDPLISGKMATAMVQGIQKNCVAATVKHFACNNKEINRFHSVGLT